jgi:amino acid adenylation domain-containing protein/non-ribosomal peptide synthase protein (TIGR01720 family)
MLYLKEHAVMGESAQLSGAKRALLEKYLRGDLLQATQVERVVAQRTQQDLIPLSLGQQQLWLLSQLLPDTPIYTECVTIHLPGLLDRSALEQSFNEFIRRHEIWRTSFQTIDGQPFQRIHPPPTFTLSVVDLSNLSEAKREAEVLRLAIADANRPFDLVNGPLLRPLLIRLGKMEHRLYLTLHHIIFDGVAIYQVFLPELFALYEAFSSGQPSPLPPLPIQYADFAVWQREWLQEEVLTRHLSYWKKQLAGASSTLALPTDHPRPPILTYRGSMRPFALSLHLTEALKSLSHREGVTLYMTLVAAFSTLLFRYTGQDDMLIGTVIAGRQRQEVQKLMGFFLNTLVLRIDPSGNPTFQELLGRVREIILEAHAHQDLPFEYLVKQLQPERNLSQNPLIQVMISIEPTLPVLPSGWTLTQMDIDTETTKLDLDLELDDRPEGLIGRFVYSTDLFDAQTIARMLGHWNTILMGIVAHPEQRLSDLPILTEAERRLMLVEWNNTAVDFTKDQCYHQLFEAQVQRAPDAVAVVFEDEHLTYRELNRRANQLAHHLQALGVGPETVVSLLAERGTAFLIAILAVFKAGGAYLPLDPHHPPIRLRGVLTHSSSRFVLTSREFAPTLSQMLEDVESKACPQIMYLEDLQFRDGQGEGNLPVHTTIHHLAYVIYTSGSTGMPKGVMIEHQGMLNHIYAKITSLDLTVKDSVAQNASQCFDISVWQFLAVLLVGGRVHIFPDVVAHDPVQLLGQVDQHGITILETVPSLLRTMLDVCEATLVQRLNLKTLRWFIATGEALPADLCRRWLSLYPHIPLLNAYGPTECSDDVTHHPISVPPAETESYMPIGRALQNTRLYVLDHMLRPVPIGVNGELYIGGIGVGRGYLSDAQRTAEAFVPDTFGEEPGARLYKTGDLARYLPDGTLQFLGRIDQQVKIRGNRIELGEIQAVLCDHPSVREAVAIARESVPGDTRIIAYLVPDPNQPVAVSDVRRFLKERLPEYMIPSTIILLERLPLTPNGKVDLRALPTPEADRSGLEVTYVAPRTATELVLASIWGQVLRLDQVGTHDNFFELGGDSILSIQIIARAHQAGLQLTPKQLFQYQTIAELAANATPIRPLEADQGTVTGKVPLTPIQHWFFEQHFWFPHHWNQAWLLEVNRELDERLLAQAVQEVVVHHDALRMRFKREGTGWQQCYAEKEMAEIFRQVNLSGLSGPEQEMVREKLIAEAQASLNLETGPLLRVVYFSMGPTQPASLLLVIHHLVVDGVSWRILLEDLVSVYQLLRDGKPAHLPAKTTSFQQWAQCLTRYAQSTALKQELAHWLHLPWDTICALPVDYVCEPEANTVASTQTVEVVLSAKETQALLQTVPKAYHTQINDVLLTAFVQTFARWTGKSTLLVDLEGHGREPIGEEVDLSRSIGWFTTMFPVHLTLTASSSGDALKGIKEQLRQIPGHGIGYGIVRYLGEQGDIRRLKELPHAQVSFNYLGQFDSMISEAGLFKLSPKSAGPTCNPQEMRHYLLEINGLVVDDHLQITWLYSERVHRRGTVESLAQYYLEALRTLIAHCQSPEAGGYTPSDFPLAKLNEQELSNILISLGRSEVSPGSHTGD